MTLDRVKEMMMKLRHFGLGALILSLAALAQAKGAPDINIQLAPKNYPFTFVGYGDIRFTNPANTEASDPARRQALVQQVAKEHPDFLVITGDLVLAGANQADWAEYDRETAPWRDAGIKIFPVLGNHDVRGGGDALPNYFERFPQIKDRRWYSVKYGNVLALALDSDSDDVPGSQQGEWLRSQLANVPSDVDFIFVATHHPEYTKSSDEMPGGGHSERPQEQQLAHLLEQTAPKLRQKIIAVSGHVHNYERYEHGGVTYIVSGGGGATPYMIQRSPGDAYDKPGPTYHYCTFKVDHGKLHFEMHRLDMNGGAHFSVQDQFDLKTGE